MSSWLNTICVHGSNLGSGAQVPLPPLGDRCKQGKGREWSTGAGESFSRRFCGEVAQFLFIITYLDFQDQRRERIRKLLSRQRIRFLCNKVHLSKEKIPPTAVEAVSWLFWVSKRLSTLLADLGVYLGMISFVPSCLWGLRRFLQQL